MVKKCCDQEKEDMKIDLREIGARKCIIGKFAMGFINSCGVKNIYQERITTYYTVNF